MEVIALNHELHEQTRKSGDKPQNISLQTNSTALNVAQTSVKHYRTRNTTNTAAYCDIPDNDKENSSESRTDDTQKIVNQVKGKRYRSKMHIIFQEKMLI